ncbi:MAG: hypothetical protein ACYSYL_15750 [Planctomycetota bacterium]|jgi:hypothetical protein
MDKIRRNQNSVKNWLALIIIIAGFCLAYPSTAEAAVVVSGSVSVGTAEFVSQITVPHTTPSGTNRLMLVGISYNNDGLETVTSVTYNGVDMGPAVGTVIDSDDAYAAIYKLVAPTEGTYDVVVTLNQALLDDRDIIVGVMTFTGVDQSTPLGSFFSNNGNDAGPATVTVTDSAAGEIVFSVFAGEDDVRNIAVDNETQRWNEDPGPVLHPSVLGQSELGGGSTEVATGSSVEMKWTLGAMDHWALGAVSIKPAPDGTLTLANHTYGQISDRFRASSPITDVLYRFRLTRTGTATVDNVRVNFTTAGGVANGDVSNGELWEDVDNDGVVDEPGDTQIQGSVTPSSGVLTFTNNFSPGTGGTNYLVRATVSNLTGGDATTFSVGTADICYSYARFHHFHCQLPFYRNQYGYPL